MAIERCPNGHVYDRDWNTECPRCPIESMSAMKEPARIEINDEPRDLIRILRDETNSRDVFERCKRVLGEA